MRTINSNQCVKIPRGIEASVKSRIVTIKGPRGVLKRNFKHLSLDIHMSSPRTLKVEKWFGTKKELAAVRTVCSHIQNMIKGKSSESSEETFSSQNEFGRSKGANVEAIGGQCIRFMVKVWWSIKAIASSWAW